MKDGQGAVITKNNRVISTGYNGTPFGQRNCNEGGCARCAGKQDEDEDMDKCLCLNSVESAIIEAGRSRTMDCTIYTTNFPC